MLRALAFVVAVNLLSAGLTAQEFSVYTKVFDLDGQEPNRPIACSRTLFHAKKVYDVIQDTGEVTILEPSQKRILILNGNRNVVSQVEFDELKHLLRTAEDRLAQRVSELEDQNQTNPRLPQIGMLRFQLRPKFESQFDARERRLRLQSPPVTYEVLGAVNVQPESIDAYLEYADWICRLNYVLHPQPLFPNVRLEMNEHLRRQKLLPIRVTLRAKLDRPLNLKAEHLVTWKMDTLDRQSIHHWELLLRDSKLQKVTLTEYQRLALGQQTAKAR